MDTMVYEAGKGGRYRKVDKEKYGNNYDLIFGKKKNEPVQDSPSAERALAQSEAETKTES